MINIQKPLYWHQGLFLQPQHFQLLDLSMKSHLAPIYNYMTPFLWGTGEIHIQRTALGARSFDLIKGDFLFPDGTYAVVPGNAIIESRSFNEAWVEGGKPFSVYVGVKKWNANGENVTSLQKLEGLSEVTTRFVTTHDPEEVSDLHSGGPRAHVRNMHYLLKIFWELELEQLGDYLMIEVAQIERMGEEIRLSEHFVPPCLTLSGSEPLNRLVKEIRDQITARSHQLEEMKRQRGIQTAEFGSRDMVFLLALRSLNRYVPMFLHLTETNQVHPWIVYGALRQLIGELSSFSERVNVLGEVADGSNILLPYDHMNLWNCFSVAQMLITQLLFEITAGPDYVIRLLPDGTYYGAELKPAIFEGRNRFYLVLKTEEDPKLILPTISTVAKLSAREHMPILIARALPGIKLEHLSVLPQELPRRLRSLYFAIDHHSDQWNMIVKNHNIALYWDSAPDDLEVELMVVGRQ
jgi:type VI secretion system protein ImpJ